MMINKTLCMMTVAWIFIFFAMFASPHAHAITVTEIAASNTAYEEDLAEFINACPGSFEFEDHIGYTTDITIETCNIDWPYERAGSIVALQREYTCCATGNGFSYLQYRGACYTYDPSQADDYRETLLALPLSDDHICINMPEYDWDEVSESDDSSVPAEKPAQYTCREQLDVPEYAAAMAIMPLEYLIAPGESVIIVDPASPPYEPPAIPGLSVINTLQGAVDLAAPSNNKIVLCPGRYQENVVIVDAYHDGLKILNLAVASDAPRTVIDAMTALTVVQGTNDDQSVFEIVDVGDLEIAGITITMSTQTDCSDLDPVRDFPDLGGGIFYYSSRNPTPTSRFHENHFACNRAARHGGALYGENVAIEMERNTLTHNAAHDSGGGIFILNTGAPHRTTTLTSNTITENIARLGGGGIFMHGGTTLVQYNTITHNYGGLSMEWGGGGLYLENVSGAVSDNSAISDNSADYIGGGMMILRCPTLVISGNIFERNLALSGGGMILSDTDVTLEENTIHQNIGYLAGGGIGIMPTAGSTVTLNGDEIMGNASNQGAGIMIMGGHEDSSTLLDHVRLLDNLAILASPLDPRNYTGGGIHAESPQQLYIVGGTLISGNLSRGSGAGISLNTCTADLDRVQIIGNRFLQNSEEIAANYDVIAGLMRGYAMHLDALATYFPDQSIAPDMQRRAASFSEIIGEVLPPAETVEWSNARGGGIFAVGTSLLVRNSTVSENISGTGGGIYAQEVSRVFMDIILESIGKPLNLINTVFQGNQAVKTMGQGHGGAVFFAGSTPDPLTINGCNFNSNAATGSGGAVFIGGNVEPIHLQASIFSNNAANSGGAIFLDPDPSAPKIIDAEGGVEFMSNCANYAGNAITLNGADYLTLRGGSFLQHGSYSTDREEDEAALSCTPTSKGTVTLFGFSMLTTLNTDWGVDETENTGMDVYVVQNSNPYDYSGMQNVNCNLPFALTDPEPSLIGFCDPEGDEEDEE